MNYENRNDMCSDLVHRIFGAQFTQYNRMGDYLIFVQMLILAFITCTGRLSPKLVMYLVLISMVFYVLRQLCANVTVCMADLNMEHKALTSQDARWFIMSGHTFFTLLAAYAIQSSRVPNFLKWVSWGVSGLVMFFQTATREHYTVDILLTAFSVYVVLKAFIMPCHRKAIE